jgi:hypothetical protein
MRAPVALLLIGCAALGACKPDSTPKSVLAEEAVAQEAAAAMTGWDRLFNSPATTIPAVNQFGFKATAYAASTGGAEAKGEDIALSTVGDAPNKASFAATGKDVAKIDKLIFALAITDPANAANAKTRLETVIRDFMFSAKAEGAQAIEAAIDAEKPAEGTLPGASYAVTVQPISGATDNRVLTVTFTRPDTTSATSSS